MARTVKSCDLPLSIAAKVFEALNRGNVQVVLPHKWQACVRIYTDVEPKELTFPEGWYYAKGCFRNKHTSSTGRYEEAMMYNTHGNPWKEHAIYCTLDSE